MQKLYTKNYQQEHLIFPGILLLILFIGALIFHPTLSLFHYFQREQKVNQLLTEMQKPTFSMREYWQFREFYSPGSFRFDTQTVTLAGALQFNTIASPSATLLTFSSPHLESTDSIVERSLTTDYLSLAVGDVSNKQILFRLSDRLAYQTEDEKIHLVFLRSTDEMKQTLGVFDYGKAEDEVLAHKWWLNQTTISK